ncbi:hypothetical protein FJT64_006405 [Amphibalanus amphitrite]|uniref:Uncharacterized protein n=1 Tax=Amphibalanus amphitrite TaxID=1232801 RepID=A0A6A4VWV8_AMPAM|nr:hypothetical protein FJT64_006405 [Amphibalanus amphitrite]
MCAVAGPRVLTVLLILCPAPLQPATTERRLDANNDGLSPAASAAAGYPSEDENHPLQNKLRVPASSEAAVRPTPVVHAGPPAATAGRAARGGAAELSSREERSADGDGDEAAEAHSMPSDRPWEVFIGGCILANGLGVYLVLLIKGIVFRVRYRRLRRPGRGRHRHRRAPGDSRSGSGSGSGSGSRASSARSGSSKGSQNKDSLVTSLKNIVMKPGSSGAGNKAKKSKDSSEKAKKK